jgi:hypothetical protein
VVNFASSMVPRYLRRSESISAWAAFAYLRASPKEMSPRSWRSCSARAPRSSRRRCSLN